jgi:5'-3' exonuclease
MGIKDFHKWIRSSYPKSFSKKWLDGYDNVYIDINFALHNCCYGAKSTEDILKRLYAFIDSVIQEILPTSTLIICADGSAPLSKIITQRKRRQDKMKSISEENINTSSVILTPSTTFMLSLEENIKQYTTFISKCYNVNVIVDINEPDEAELKLKRIMQHNINIRPKESHIIVTNDADVVVMLMTLQDVSHTYVYYKLTKDYDIISMGKLLNEHVKTVGKSKNASMDFACISIMMGNDYLPKIMCATFDKMWNAYKSYISYDKNGLMSKNLTLNIKCMIAILSGIVCKSKALIKKSSIGTFFDPMYSTYMEGYMWCIQTYATGECKRYDFMYSHKGKINPLELIANIGHKPHITKISTKIFPPINGELYSVLVLPHKCKQLLSSDMKHFMSKVKILYEEELCKECNKIKLGLIKLNVQLNELDKDDDKDEYKNISKQLSMQNKKIVKHKLCHKDITLSDIKQIMCKFKTYMKSL